MLRNAFCPGFYTRGFALTMALSAGLVGGVAAQPLLTAAPAAPGGAGTSELLPLAVVAVPAPAMVGDTLGLQPLTVVLPSAPVTVNSDGTLGLQPLPQVSPTIAGPAMPAGILELYPLVVFSPPAPDATPAAGSVGSQAPAFSLLTPQGETVALPEAANGQPTLLLFWPSWCPYSRALQPYVQSIWEDYRDRGVKVWTINIEETQDPVTVMKERQLSFPLLVAGNPVADQFGVRLMPALILIDAQNQIVYKMHEKTTSPIEAARQVRAALNGLLGDQAVALPLEYPKAYDLHLLSLQALNLRMTPIPIPQSEWEPWMDHYLATLRPGEVLAEIPARGTIANGKQAISIAREIWSQKYGSEQTLIQAPYRSYRVNNHWVVLASGDSGASAKLGEGFIAVIEVDSGRVVRVVPRQ